MKTANSVNVLCLKWGTDYPAHYVNRLYAGVKAHLARPFRFVCVTDDPSGLDAGVEAVPFPPAPDGWRHVWPHVLVKLYAFRDGFADLHGPTLFLDIDQIILGDLDRFFDYEPGRFCIIRNWIEWRKRIFRRVPDVGNSSCFRFDAGTMNRVWEQFLTEKDVAYKPQYYRTEQAFMTHAVGLENIVWWPSAWVQSFKRSCTRPFPLNLLLEPKPPKNCSILCFHGQPNPHQAVAGYRKHHINTWTRPCAWVDRAWKDERQETRDER